MSDAKPAGTPVSSGNEFPGERTHGALPPGSLPPGSLPPGAELPTPGAVKPVLRPNLPRTGVDARELARVLARQQLHTAPLLPPVEDPPGHDLPATQPAAPAAVQPAAVQPAAVQPAAPRAAVPVARTAPAPVPSPAVPAALRADGDASPLPRAPRGMELARAPRALSAMEALDAARAAERATVPGANLTAPHTGGPARGPVVPPGPRLAAPRANTSPFSTARPRVEAPRIAVASLPTAPTPPTPTSSGDTSTVGARAPRGLALPPAARALSAEDALVAARAAEASPVAAPPEPVMDGERLPPSGALMQGVQAVLATCLPDVPARVTAVATVEPRAHLALWKAHRARLAGQGDLRGALTAAAIIQTMTTRPQHLIFVVVQAAPPRTEAYFLAVDLDLRLPVAVLPEPDRWGVRF